MNNQFVGKVKAGEVITYVVLALLVIFTIVPIVFMFCASFMDAKQILAMPFKWLPSKDYFTSSSRTFLTNFVKAVRGNNYNNIFFTAMLNSLIVAITCSVTTVFFSALCGYGLAKFHFKGRNVVFMAIMSTMMIPFEAIMIPLYLVSRSLGIMNTLPGLMVLRLRSTLSRMDRSAGWLMDTLPMWLLISALAWLGLSFLVYSLTCIFKTTESGPERVSASKK